MRALHLSAIPVAFALLAAAAAQEGYLLRLKLEPGVITSYKVTNNMSGTMSSGMMGGYEAQEMVIKQTMVMRHKLAGVKEDIGTFITTFKDFDIEMTMGGMDISQFAGADKDQVEKITITSRINQRGETVESKFEGLPESMAGMSMSGGANFNMMALLPVFPENPIQIGESWTSVVKNPMLATMGERGKNMKLPDVKIVSKLEAVEKLKDVDCYRISFELSLPMDMDMSGMMGGGGGEDTSVKSSGTSKIKGMVWLNKDTCALAKQTFDSQTDMTIKVQGMTEMEMNIRMAGKGSVEQIETK
ncbi:MAG: hypothetical protein AMXMBFR61_04990 [Fimbriimonadales bacterium]